jgi:molybdopterin synthase catalytic subunit
MIRVQSEPFDWARELAKLKSRHPEAGGSVLFLGSVREMTPHGSIGAISLEHYPGMTEKALADIEAEALARWPLCASLIVHRHGRLKPGEDIVLVATLARHREPAFEACQFLIDWLKTKAPFWKSEETAEAQRWVEAEAADDAAARRWQHRR